MRIITRNIVGAFIFSSDNKILLGKSRTGGVYKDCWIVPGGGIEKNESHIDAVKREVLEETGLDISTADIKRIEGHFTGESEKVLKDTNERVLVKMTFFDFLITFTLPAKDLVTRPEDDLVDVRWFSKEELQILQLSPPTRTILKLLEILS
jgi:8-oxo-dGTP diphosphatase